MVAHDIAVAAGRKRQAFVEKTAGKGDNRAAAVGIVSAAGCRHAGLVDGVGAVERVVQAAPARIGGV